MQEADMVRKRASIHDETQLARREQRRVHVDVPGGSVLLLRRKTDTSSHEGDAKARETAAETRDVCDIIWMRLALLRAFTSPPPLLPSR